MASLSGGVAVLSAAPASAGVQTITALYSGDASNHSSRFDLTLTVGKATPTLSWATPASISVGTPLGITQLDAVATFHGVALPGVFTYSPPEGTILPTGDGQILNVSFTPSDSVDFKPVTASVPINVVPQPPRVQVIGEQPIFRRPMRKGKPAGKAILTGFSLIFNQPLDEAAASRVSNYEVDTVMTRRVKKKVLRNLMPIRNFTVSYAASNDSVTLTLTRTQTFPAGGRLKILPGVTGATGGVLSGSTVFAIAPGGKKITP